MKPTREALLIIDMQNGFLETESPLCIPSAKETVPACARALEAARKRGMAICFVTRAYRSDGSDVELCRKACWERGGKPLSPDAKGPLSTAMPRELTPLEGEYCIVKPRFSAFFHTELDLLLRRLGVQTLYLAGTTTPNCVRTTCYDALSLDYSVTVLADCCSSRNESVQQANIEDMRNIGCTISTSKELG